ncbi:MAG: hypothetical protein ACLQVI_13210 [Polyangiaceae bacterium]
MTRAPRLAVAFALVARAAKGAGGDDRFAEPVQVHASDVEIDARTREAVLKGDVRVDAPPFHLRSDELRVLRTARGAVEVDGSGRLTFCPCLGAPLAVRFEGATVAPPGDLILKSPSLEVLGAPVLWLPYFWLRAPEKPGILPPDVAYRGADGMFLGDGIHLPLQRGDARSALDLRAGGYFEGGVAVDGVLTTATTATHVGWDHLHGDGLTIDMHGAIEEGAPVGATLAWDADAIRGARGVVATTDLGAAAKPYDRVTGETSWRDGGWTLATGVRAIAPRGGGLTDLGAAGPTVTLRRAEAIGGAGAYDAILEGGALHETGRTVSFARGELGTLLADRWGPLGASLALRAAGDAVADGDGTSTPGAPAASQSGVDGAASARARVALPLSRSFESTGRNDPWVHRLEPAVEAAVLTVQGDDLLGVMPGRGMSVVRGNAWTSDVALASEQGRWGARIGSDVSVAVGAVGSLEEGSSASLVTRGHAALSASFAGLSGEGARVWTQGGNGGAFTARARIGELRGPHLVLLAAERDGIDPVLARALTDAPLEPSSGFLSAMGWTAGARAGIPWTYWLTTTGGADVDLTAQMLVAARGGIELRDHCGCLRVRANAAHRLGREGVDVWVTVDLAPR